jgi:hypothetical protein
MLKKLQGNLGLDRLKGADLGETAGDVKAKMFSLGKALGARATELGGKELSALKSFAEQTGSVDELTKGIGEGLEQRQRQVMDVIRNIR